jgi:hypothetical protein
MDGAKLNTVAWNMPELADRSYGMQNENNQK